MTEIRDRRHSSWFWMDKALLDEHGQTIGAYGIAVYALLARYADNKGQAFPSLVTMSKALRMSKHSVIRTIEALCIAGVIEKSQRTSEHGDATTNIYTLLHVGGSATDAPPSAPQALPSATDALGVVPQMHHPSAPQALPPLYRSLTRLTEQELLEQEKKELPSIVPPSAKKPTTRAQAIPTAWSISTAIREWAAEAFPSINLSAEAEKFRDYYRAHGKPMKDWDAAFRNWIRKAAEMHPSPPPVQESNPRKNRVVL